MLKQSKSSTKAPPGETSSSSPSRPQTLADVFARWRDDPARLAWDLFRVRLWRKQRQICRAIARHGRVAVKSGHKIGKSIVAAVIAIWWVLTRPNGRVVMTAPTANQIRSILWMELRKLVAIAEERLAAAGFTEGLGGRLHEMPDAGYQFAPGQEIVGRSTNKAERMAGTSSDELLYIVDEASGVDERIFEVIEGNLTGGGSMLMLSNPTQPAGTFYRAFHGERSLYETITVSSEETPNVIARRKVLPGLAQIEAIRLHRIAWGPKYLEDPRYQVRVLGEFPSKNAHAVVPLGLVEAAVIRAETTPDEGPLELGVDVARFGDDDTVVISRRGLRTHRAVAVNGFDNVAVAGLVMKTVRERRRGYERVTVKVDGAGNGGGVVDTLRAVVRDENLEWLSIVEVNSADKATDEEEYVNRRAELAFGVTKWLKAGGAFEHDGTLEEDLVASQYNFDKKGRCQIEKKDAIKARIGRSPDRGDALALAVWDAEPTGFGDDAPDSEESAEYRFPKQRGYG